MRPFFFSSLVGCLVGIAAACGALPHSASVTAQEKMEFDQTGKGAVLCSHWILANLHQVLLLCDPGREELAGQLAEVLSSYEAFIARNSELTLNAAKRLTQSRKSSVLLEGKTLDGATCADVHLGAKSFYDQFAPALTTRTIRDQTIETLSIERKPVMNPCL